MEKDQKGITARDRDLWFGMAALQLHLIGPADLQRAAAARAERPDRDLGAALVELGLLAERDRSLIEQLLSHDALGPLVEALTALLEGEKSAAAAQLPVAEEIAPTGTASALMSFGGDTPAPAVSAEGPAARLDDTESITLEHPGRYTIKGEHGRGGIGRVLIAFDQHIGREVALKELLPARAVSNSGPNQSPMRVAAQATARFLRESRITGQLEHPGIVPVYELARRTDGSFFYTMKLVRGKTLADRLSERQNLSDRLRLLPHFLDLGHTMAYAHSKGVIHRDLKPANVMVGEFGETVVLDWGLAKVKGLEDVRATELEDGLRLIREASAGQTTAGQTLGTPSYMSPEQAEGKIEEIDERSDVWSLGALLYELLTGRPPFTGDLAYEVIGKVMTAAVAPVASLEPQAPPELCAIAEKCLQRDRGLRYPSARELAEDVAKFQSGGLVSAYEYSMAALLGRWVKKSWPVVITAAAALVLVAVLGTWSFLRIREERNLAVVNEQKAQEQKALAETREREANANLQASYLILGRFCESKKAMNSAAIYYAQALVLDENPEARYSLNYVWTVPRVSGRLLRVLPGHTNTVADVKFSPDGRLVASASRDGSVKLWEAGTGRLLHSLPASSGWVTALAFHPGGKTIASGSEAAIKIWDVTSGQLLLTLSGHAGSINSLAISPDGRTLASASGDQTIKLWDAETGRLRLTLVGHSGSVTAIAFNPDGKNLVSGGRDRIVRLWDPDSGQRQREFHGHTDRVTSVAATPDGKIVASASRDQSVKLWDRDTGKLLRSLEWHESWVWGIAVSPDGKTLASASEDQTVKLWDIATGKNFLSLEGHNDWLPTVAFSPDGRTLASGSADKTVRIWEIEEEQQKSSYEGLPGPVLALAFQPSGPPLAAVNDHGMVRLKNIDTGGETLSLEGPSGTVTAARPSPDLKTLAIGGADGTVKIRDASTGKILWTLTGHTGAIYDLAISADGKTLISAANDHLVKVWDLTNGQPRFSLDQHSGPVLALALAPDGKTMASGGKDQVVMIWNVVTGQRLHALEGHSGPIVSLAFSSDGKVLASGSMDHSVKLWDPSTGNLLRTLTGHTGRVLCLAFFPDRKVLASSGADVSIKLWDTASGKLLHSLEAHTDWVTALAVSADGKTLASGGLDKTVKLWTFLPEVLNGDPQKLLKHAEKNAGLIIKGIDLYPLDPAAGTVSETPMPKTF